MRNGIQEKLLSLVQNVFKVMAVKIQARLRTKKEVANFKVVKKSTVKMQLVIRMIQAKVKFQKQKATAIRTQALVRCHQQSTLYQKKRLSAQKIAAVVRGHQASEGFKQTKASIKLQSKLRSQYAQKKLMKAKKAQATIGANIRAKQGKKKYDETREVLIMLQNAERMRAARKSFKATKSSALKLQSVYRMIHATVRFKRQRKAAVMLEAAQRRIHLSRVYRRQKEAALLLHNVVRRFCAMAKLEHLKMGLFSGKKRRNNSVVYLPQGDYIKAREDAMLMNWLKEGNDKEDEDPEIVFADSVQKFNRKGKKQKRHVILTKRYCYFMDKNKTKSCYCLAEHAITGSSLSTMADDFIVLHIEGERDLLMTCEHKTEMIMIMAKVVRETLKEDFPITCSDSFTFQTYGGGFSRSNVLKEVNVKFYEDEEVTEAEKWRLAVSNGGSDFTVVVAPALVSEAMHPLGVPRAAKFQVNVGGRKKTHAPPLENQKSKKGILSNLSSKVIGMSRSTSKSLGRARSSFSGKSTGTKTTEEEEEDDDSEDEVVSGVNTFRGENVFLK